MSAIRRTGARMNVKPFRIVGIVVVLAAGCGTRTPAPTVPVSATNDAPPASSEPIAQAKVAQPAEPAPAESKDPAPDSATDARPTDDVAKKAEPESDAEASSAEAAPPSPETPMPAENAPPRHVANFVFLGDRAPIFIRLQFHVGSTPIDQAREQLAETLSTEFDVDQDGLLSAKEFPTAVFRRDAGPGDRTVPEASTFDADSDGNIDKREIVRGIERLGPLLSLNAGRPLDPRVLELFRYLDRSYDHALTRDEFEHSDQALRRFDLDDDELISIDELGGYQSPAINVSQSMERNGTGPFRLLPFTEEQDRKTYRRLYYYDWSQRGLGCSDEDFARYDLDKDGEIGKAELPKLLENAPPHLDLVVRFGELDQNQSAVEIASDPARLETVFASARRPSERAVVIEVDGLRITLRLEDDAAAIASARRTRHQQFLSLDTDNNGYLEPNEFPVDASFFGPFESLDLDGDDQLYEPELARIFDYQMRVQQLRGELSTSLLGRSLFEMIDDNRDRRLSRRELLAGGAMLSEWDQDADDRLTLAEIPRHYELVLRRSQPQLVRLVFMTSEVQRTTGKTQAQTGPRWFRRMDANGDGDVSLREFLGSAEQFKQLDANGDKILDPQEVAGLSTESQ